MVHILFRQRTAKGNRSVENKIGTLECESEKYKYVK